MQSVYPAAIVVIVELQKSLADADDFEETWDSNRFRQEEYELGKPGLAFRNGKQEISGSSGEDATTAPAESENGHPRAL